jgi:hypothetical protein
MSAGQVTIAVVVNQCGICKQASRDTLILKILQCYPPSPRVQSLKGTGVRPVKIQRQIWRVFLTLLIVSSSALVVTAQDASRYVINSGKRVEMTTTFQGAPTSYTKRGNDNFSVGYYVKDGAIVKKNSLLADKDEPVSKLNLDVNAVGVGFDAILATGKATDITVTGSLNASDKGDGHEASDFSGLGAMFLVTNYAKVRVDNMKIETKGFARSAFVPDTHGQILVTNSKVTVLGANPLTQTYKEYVNSANQNIMVSPPWVLGIMGGARVACMLGDNPTMSVVNSDVATGGWAVLSTDAGNNFMLNVVDSELRVLTPSEGGMTSGKYSYSAKYGSGYGSYLIGNATENFYGVNYSGSTYALIASGGVATWKSSKGQIKLMDADGGEIETVTGKGRPTTINSVFGFYGQGSGTLKVLDGTVVNAEDAIILHRSGSLDFTADHAVMSSKAGILLQMIDNDDKSIGGTMMAFKTDFYEKAGWPSENGNVTQTSASASGAAAAPRTPEEAAAAAAAAAAGPGGPAAGPGGPGPMGASGPGLVKLALTNGDYKGNVYNGSGYYTQTANNVEVTVGAGATLTGEVALTETRHVDETGKQNTHFTINEYYYLGRVGNRKYRNGHATATVTLKEGGVWKVTGESWITKLELSGGSIEGANGAKLVMKVGGKETPIQPGQTYSGEIVIALK